MDKAQGSWDQTYVEFDTEDQVLFSMFVVLKIGQIFNPTYYFCEYLCCKIQIDLIFIITDRMIRRRIPIFQHQRQDEGNCKVGSKRCIW